MESNQMESKQMESKQMESNQMESKQMESKKMESNQMYMYTSEDKSMLYYIKPVSNNKFSDSGISAQVKTIPTGTVVVLIPNTYNQYHPTICEGLVVKWGLADEHNIYFNSKIFVDTSKVINIEILKDKI